MKATTKTVVVLGASYGGCRVAQLLASSLPDGWRILLIDRNSHVNHVYIIPRLAVLSGHEHKGFIPYRNVFMRDDPSMPHKFLQAQLTSMQPNHIVLSRAFPEHGIESETIHFDYAVYALGSKLPAPVDLWNYEPEYSTNHRKITIPQPPRQYGGNKSDAINWLRKYQEIIQESDSVLVVGGGALGIQFATDIAAIYPGKTVTLLHSRRQLLPRFERELHREVMKALDLLNVNVILGERLDLSSLKALPETGPRFVRTAKGKDIPAELILLCTGQVPNTSFLREMDPRIVNPENSMANVHPTMQLSIRPRDPEPDLSDPENLAKALDEVQLEQANAMCPEGGRLTPEPTTSFDTPYPHIFAIGDAADAFGALQAGHNAYYQADIAAKNILRMIKHSESTSGKKVSNIELERYRPGPPAIKVSLGLTRSAYQVNGVVGARDDGQDDLQAALMWPCFGIEVKEEKDMYE